MPGSAGDVAGSFGQLKRNSTRSKSSSELEEMRHLFKTNRDSLREFENSPEILRHRVHFADVSGCSDVGKIGWGQLQLLHSASQRLQSPSEPLPTPLRSLHHPSESYNYMSMDDKRPLTPSGSEIERKYQRMLAVVEERMTCVKEKEAYLQHQRQELADKETLFESERSAVVLLRQKYMAADAMMSEAHALQVKAEKAVAIASASHFESETKWTELQNQLRAAQTELAAEKLQRDSLQRLHKEESEQRQSKIDTLEQENSSLLKKLILEKESVELQTRKMQSQLDVKDSTILKLQESLTEMRQQVELLQMNVKEIQQQHVHTCAQRDAEILDVQRQKESLASSEAALEAAHQQLRDAHLEIEATAAMLLSDCSARQHAATEEVEKAKAQLQELQEQIAERQRQQQSLQQEISIQTSQLAILHDEASHIRNLRHIRQQEEIELQNVRVWTEEHFRHHQIQLQSLQQDIADQKSQLAQLRDEASHFRDLRKQQRQEEFELRNAHLEIEAAAAMLLSDCSARQHAASEEVEKAKAQLQELQEQIAERQRQQQSLQQDFSDSLSSQLVQLTSRVCQKDESPYPVFNVSAAAAFLDPSLVAPRTPRNVNMDMSLVTPQTPRNGNGDLFTFAASPAMTPNTFGKKMSTRW